MSRRSIVSRLVAVAVLAAPALALAGAGTDQPPKNCGSSCHCAKMHEHAGHAQHMKGASSTTPAPTATTPEDVQRIWNSP